MDDWEARTIENMKMGIKDMEKTAASMRRDARRGIALSNLAAGPDNDKALEYFRWLLTQLAPKRGKQDESLEGLKQEILRRRGLFQLVANIGGPIAATSESTDARSLAARWNVTARTASGWIARKDFPRNQLGRPHRIMSEDWVRAHKPAIAKRLDAAIAKRAAAAELSPWR